MSAGIDTTTFEAIVRQAQRAPTAHNTQPALFRLNNPREIAILGDARRALSVSDPSRRDYLMGLGAVAEGVRLALAERGIAARIEPMSNNGDAPVSGDHRCVARVLIDGACEPDPLGSQVAHRRSYRGSFAKLSAEQVNAARQRLGDIPGAVLVTDQPTIAALTNHYEAANLSSLRDPAFVGELWHWLRLNPHHANYDRDGLNADCMAMSGIERRLAGLVMRPAVLPRLLRIPFSASLISERAKMLSASLIVLLTDTAQTPPIELGVTFYRIWLTLTACGIVATPISALVDDPRASRACIAHLGLQGRLIAAWRCGASAQNAAHSPRLPVAEVIVET